jgi:predicted AlkP superfamily pyrophosphatase or phosphodiesterase
MNRRFRVAWAAKFITLLLLIQGLLAHPLAQVQTSKPHLILISIDGFVPDYYLNPDRFGLKIPTIRRLRKNGAFSEGVVGVYPSVTYPSHTTIITGAKPLDHGIYSNRVFEEPTAVQTRQWYWEADRIKTDTLWAAARRAGLRTAAVSWPVTVGAEIDYNIPEVWEPGTEDGPTVEAARRSAIPAGLVEEILKATEKPPSAYVSMDDLRTDAAVHLIGRYRPNLLLLHLIDLDGVHHRRGPHSKEAYEEVEKQDARVQRLVDAVRAAGIEAQTTIALVSDHGFMPLEREFHPAVLLARAGLVKHDEAGRLVDWQAAILSHGGSAAVILREKNNEAVAQTVKKVFSEFAAQPNSPLSRVIERAELDKLGADPSAAFFLDAAQFCYIGGDYTGEVIRPLGRNRLGAHGYLPERLQVRASFILSGAGVNVGARAVVTKMTDIAPTLAALLGIELKAPSSSRPVTPFLVQERRPRAGQ